MCQAEPEGSRIHPAFFPCMFWLRISLLAPAGMSLRPRRTCSRPLAASPRLAHRPVPAWRTDPAENPRQPGFSTLCLPDDLYPHSDGLRHTGKRHKRCKITDGAVVAAPLLRQHSSRVLRLRGPSLKNGKENTGTHRAGSESGCQRGRPHSGALASSHLGTGTIKANLRI